MYADRILAIISPMTTFSSSILARHCRSLGKTPDAIGADDLDYLAIAIARSITLFAGSDRGRLAAHRIRQLDGRAAAAKRPSVPSIQT